MTVVREVLGRGLLRVAGGCPVIALAKPQRSNGSALLGASFPSCGCMSLRSPSVELFTASSPGKFLTACPSGAVVSRIRRIPSLFSCVRACASGRGHRKVCLLTKSRGFLLVRGIGRSLTNQATVLGLLPFSRHRVGRNNVLPGGISRRVFGKTCPHVCSGGVRPSSCCPFCVRACIRQSIHLVQGVKSLDGFVHFLGLYTKHVKRLLGLSSLTGRYNVSIATTAT